MTNEVKREEKGHFAKGVSGNPKGRPKITFLTDDDLKEFKDDPHKALLFLLNTAKTKDEVFKYAKELMPYVKPKLSSVKQEIQEDRTITIKIEGFNPIAAQLPKEEPKVIEAQAQDVQIDGLSKEDVQKAAQNRIKELKKKKASKKEA